MSDTQIWRASRIHTAQDPASPAGDTGSRSRRLAVRIWTLMHAQAVLNGATGGSGDVAFIEDDRQRLAARRAR
jgi:hypothetical protein